MNTNHVRLIIIFLFYYNYSNANDNSAYVEFLQQLKSTNINELFELETWKQKFSFQTNGNNTTPTDDDAPIIQADDILNGLGDTQAALIIFFVIISVLLIISVVFSIYLFCCLHTTTYSNEYDGTENQGINDQNRRNTKNPLIV
jgi:hypothetical protein